MSLSLYLSKLRDCVRACGCTAEVKRVKCVVFGNRYSVLHLVPHLMFLDIHGGFTTMYSSPVGSIFFCYFARIVVVFFCPSSPIFNRHFLFIFPLSFPGKATVYSFVFRHLEHPAYIYIFKSLTKQDKIYKKFTLLCGFVSSPLSVHQSLESLFNLSFFSAFCTIYN